MATNTVCTTSLLTCTVTGLDTDTMYQFQVVAVNGYGPGPAATVTGTVEGVPHPPDNFLARAGAGRVALSWKAPTFFGNSVITGYHVQLSTNSGSTWTDVPECSTTAIDCTVSGLTETSAYLFRIQDLNSFGPSSYSELSPIYAFSARLLTELFAAPIVPPKSPTTIIVGGAKAAALVTVTLAGLSAKCHASVFGQ